MPSGASELTILSVAAMFAAGVAAGTINTIVGSGSLITFPTLLALGYAPVVANVTNTVGVFPGALSGTIGYRRELTGQRSRAIQLGIVAVLGGLSGGLLLLALPPTSFEIVVPFLILAACALMAIQPRLSAILTQRQQHSTGNGVATVIAVYATAVYGGYFGAAQGVMLIALLAIFLNDNLQRLNGLKNVLVMLVNGVAAITFMLIAPVAWDAAGIVAVGAIAGGQIGAILGRRLPPKALRFAVIVVGAVVAIRLLT